MKRLILRNISALEKLLPDMELNAPEMNSGSALWNETFSYQIAMRACLGEGISEYMSLEIESDIKDCIRIYTEDRVPVHFPSYTQNADNGYLSRHPGLFPDILKPYQTHASAPTAFYNAVWVDVTPDETVKPGVHEIKIIFKMMGEYWGESVFHLDVIGAKLPKNGFPYTDWFHSDCIATYYDIDVFSEEHWSWIEKFMRVARENGISMLLTPIFTPALDTMVGGERPTVQLIDVSYENGVYSFDFQKLIRWMELCRKVGIEYLEMAHLYTQWGAGHAPKIMVKENGKLFRKFGWDTEALGDEYKAFITQLLPPLKKVLEENWDKEKVYFHISDEPSAAHIEHYGEIFRFIKPLLGDFKQLDAMSDYEMFEKGYIETPVAGSDAAVPFIENNVENLWVYYCCGQGRNNLSNRMIAMPSHRTRIMGLQMYKFDIKGFLHWGFNFYYSRMSLHAIDPYLNNDADGSFPAGDPFGVYPGKDDVYPSLRLKVFYHGLQDRSAAKLLESYIGKEAVMQIIEQDGEISFTEYPLSAGYILKVREQINQKLKEAIK